MSGTWKAKICMWRFPDLTKAQQLNKLNYVIRPQLLNPSGPRFLNYKMPGLDCPISEACSSSNRVFIWTLDSNQWLTFRTTPEGAVKSEGRLNLAGHHWVTKLLILVREQEFITCFHKGFLALVSLKEKLHLNHNHEYLQNTETQVCK